jgi:hypothetical protein
MTPPEHFSGSGRTYHDPLHGAIALHGNDPTDQLLIRLIDTPAFQRLRRVRQLGPASLTFHGAEGSRFTHSLGVMAIARRAMDCLIRRYPDLQAYRATVLCAALLHDIGHGPFSHTCEEIFGSHHEHWTKRILTESVPVRSLLDQFSQTYLGGRDLLTELEQVYNKTHPIPLVGQLVSSQLDCDRLDYLMRDSYFTGATYGRLDLDRILLALRYDESSGQLVVAIKGMTSVEHYLIVRYFMYAQVYNHPKNLAAAWGLEQVFRRARQLLAAGKLSADPTVTAWLQQDCNQLPLADYLEADDDVFLYHLHRWRHQDDPLLADLCRRYLDRDLLKAMEITDQSPEEQETILNLVRVTLAEQAMEPDFYTCTRTRFSSGYTLYQRGITLKTDHGLREISELSPLVKTLIHPWKRTWLLYPREVEPILTTSV